MLVQVVLIALVLIAAAFALRAQGTVVGNAWQKIFLVFLALIAIASILFPELVTMAARVLGVGRGTDLLVYALFVVLLFYILSSRLATNVSRDRFNRLARRVAIDEAARTYGLRELNVGASRDLEASVGEELTEETLLDPTPEPHA